VAKAAHLRAQQFFDSNPHLQEAKALEKAADKVRILAKKAESKAKERYEDLASSTAQCEEVFTESAI
jgi:hypothetical protein